ncbi:hypothetical protein Agabi119p4_2392 [Agaricus bisporus var. burnettii]|uniref:Uncharacterized protein n=1 Tax=Agaricus bisporus var. burnettii TaxID=192524 RepID=A0A8H7KK28_AGABI|nr:hypothetical protein Agabi119p4_2392 [Agaricus bisporus var. burnettii]
MAHKNIFCLNSSPAQPRAPSAGSCDTLLHIFPHALPLCTSVPGPFAHRNPNTGSGSLPATHASPGLPSPSPPHLSTSAIAESPSSRLVTARPNPAIRSHSKAPPRPTTLASFPPALPALAVSRIAWQYCSQSF